MLKRRNVEEIFGAIHNLDTVIERNRNHFKSYYYTKITKTKKEQIAVLISKATQQRNEFVISLIVHPNVKIEV